MKSKYRRLFSMNIALMAHDAKKELMVQFCIAYCGILSRHQLTATGTTAKLVSEATGLKVRSMMAGAQGGDQQLVSLVGCDEIDLLLYFRDPLSIAQTMSGDMNLLRMCDSHNIPVATNIATAEVLIHGLERGDLEWRDVLRSSRKQLY
jgi:methylglyoxal synthase